MLKILQARLQQYVNHEFPDVQDVFKKGRGSRDQIANICWIIKKAREFQKTSSQVAQIVKASACNAGDPGSIPGWEDPPEKEMATHSGTFSWKIPWMEDLVGYSPWGHKESDLAEKLALSLSG